MSPNPHFDHRRWRYLARYTERTWHYPCAVALLICVISGSLFGLVAHYQGHTRGTSRVEDSRGKTAAIVTLPENDDEYEHRLPRLRSWSRYEVSMPVVFPSDTSIVLVMYIHQEAEPSNSVGRISVFIRKPTRDGSRQPLRRIHFPAARYRRGHSCSFSLIYSCRNVANVVATSSVERSVLDFHVMDLDVR